MNLAGIYRIICNERAVKAEFGIRLTDGFIIIFFLSKVFFLYYYFGHFIVLVVLVGGFPDVGRSRSRTLCGLGPLGPSEYTQPTFYFNTAEWKM